MARGSFIRRSEITWATIQALALVGFASIANASPIATCSGMSAPCTAVLLNSVSVPLFTESSASAQDVSRGGERAAATFGANRIGATDFVASVESDWLDTFVVTGGTGDGILALDWSIDGTLTVPSHEAGCPSGFPDCAVTVSYRSLGAFDPGVLSLTTLDCCGAGPKDVSASGTLLIPFTYGTPFTGGFGLTGSSAESGGDFNFLDTALVTGIVLPDGAILTAASGTTYSVAAPMPEPSSWLLLGTGGAMLLRRFRRRVIETL